MNQKLIGFLQRYVTTLRKHLKQKASASLQSALKLGRQGIKFGLEILDLARIHERALTLLKLSGNTSETMKRAECFFTEAITPIVETYRAARQSQIDLKRMNDTLRRRTLELAVTRRQLQRGIVRRKSVEAALKTSGMHHARLLNDSLQLQKGLRHLTHQLLTAQESERKKISTELQDEIAQTLLGINVRLLNLKQEARSNSKGLKNEIASTQRLVLESAQSVRKVARELRNP